MHADTVVSPRSCYVCRDYFCDEGYWVLFGHYGYLVYLALFMVNCCFFSAVNGDPTALLKLELYSPLVSVVILIGVSAYILDDAIRTVQRGPNADSSDKVDDTVMFVFAAINLVFDILNLLFFFISGQTSLLPEAGNFLTLLLLFSSILGTLLK